jgi:hypothetical protein
MPFSVSKNKDWSSGIISYTIFPIIAENPHSPVWKSESIVESIVILKSFILGFCPKEIIGRNDNAMIRYFICLNLIQLVSLFFG